MAQTGILDMLNDIAQQDPILIDQVIPKRRFRMLTVRSPVFGGTQYQCITIHPASNDTGPIPNATKTDMR